ncbi:WD40 repeat domain-containing protein [Spirochaeta cellobiosiphila]|uniref:WD40 repeat domain-containing protein n=1 Tax=Spirochaeta cellobiosiphila TaxID=504483 RepID=UPI0004039FAB|nr:WD40 repeat domain-containing protein [Spirochaeta cellobiosiphila]
MEELVRSFEQSVQLMNQLGSKVNKEAWDNTEDLIYYIDQLLDAGQEIVGGKNLTEYRALAYVQLGRLHSRYDLIEEAIAIYDDVYLEYRNHSNDAIRYQAMRALVNSGVAYYNLDRLDKAIEAWDEAGEKYYKDRHEGLQTASLRAMQNKSIALDLYKYEGAGDPTRELILERFKSSLIPAIQKDLLRFFYKILWIGEDRDNPALKALHILLIKKTKSKIKLEDLHRAYYLLDTKAKKIVCSAVEKLHYEEFINVLVGGSQLIRCKGHYPFERKLLESYLNNSEHQRIGEELILQSELDWGLEILQTIAHSKDFSSFKSPYVQKLYQLFLKENIALPPLNSWSLLTTDHSPLNHKGNISAWFVGEDSFLSADRKGDVILWSKTGPDKHLGQLSGTPRIVCMIDDSIYAVLWNQKGFHQYINENWEYVEVEDAFHKYSSEYHLLIGDKGLYKLDSGSYLSGFPEVLEILEERKNTYTHISYKGIVSDGKKQVELPLPSTALPLKHCVRSKEYYVLGNDDVIYVFDPTSLSLQSSLQINEMSHSINWGQNPELFGVMGEQKIFLYNRAGELLFDHPGISLYIGAEYCFIGDKKGKVLKMDHAGNVIHVMEGHSDWIVDITADEEQLLTIGLEGSIRQWSLIDNRLTHIWGKMDLLAIEYQGSQLHQIGNGGIKNLNGEGTFYSQIQGVLSAYYIDEEYLIYASLTGELLVYKKGKFLWRDNCNSYAESFCRIDKKIWVGFHDGMLREFSLNNGAVLWESAVHKEGILVIERHPSGQYIFTGSRDRDISIVNIETKDELQKLAMHTQNISALCFCDSGNTLISSGDDGLILKWNWLEGSLLDIIKESKIPVWDLIVNQESTVLSARVEDNDLSLWNLPYGVEINNLKGHRSVISSIKFFPDDGFMVSGSADRSLRFWKMPEGRVVKKISPGLGAVQSIAIGVNGKKLAAASVDGQIKEYDLTPFQLYRMSLNELRERKFSLEALVHNDEQDKLDFIEFLNNWMS